MSETDDGKDLVAVVPNGEDDHTADSFDCWCCPRYFTQMLETIEQDRHTFRPDFPFEISRARAIVRGDEGKFVAIFHRSLNGDSVAISGLGFPPWWCLPLYGVGTIIAGPPRVTFTKFRRPRP